MLLLSIRYANLTINEGGIFHENSEVFRRLFRDNADAE